VGRERADRLLDQRHAPLRRRGADLGRDVAAADDARRALDDQVVVPDHVVDAGEADLAEPLQRPLRLGERAGVAAHVADLDDRAGRIGGRDDRVALARPEAHRLLDQHVLSGRDRRERGVRVVRVGIGDEHHVDVGLLDERGEVLEALGHAPRVADAVEDRAADVAQRGHLEPVGELRQRRQVDDLRDLAATDHADADARSLRPHGGGG
jgi:hypothetical protein